MSSFAEKVIKTRVLIVSGENEAELEKLLQSMEAEVQRDQTRIARRGLEKQWQKSH